MTPTGLEPVTSRLGILRSILMSYGAAPRCREPPSAHGPAPPARSAGDKRIKIGRRREGVNREGSHDPVRSATDRPAGSRRRPRRIRYWPGERRQSPCQTASFPAVLRLGGGWEPCPGTRVGLSLITPLVEGERPAIWRREAGIGVEQDPRFLRVRTGVATDLARNSMPSGGMSLGPLEVGVGRLMGPDPGRG
jgi:hypothetical protein